VSHNVKAIYQRYLGWFDGNPAHLWQHPPAGQALRYVEYMGGPDAVVAKARVSADDGDLRWAAEVLGHVVFAEPDHTEGRALLADVFERLGHGAENATWRNFYLSGTHELRRGNVGTPATTASPDLIRQLTPEQMFDAVAIRVDGPRAWNERLTIDVVLTDGGRYRLTLANGVLTYTTATPSTAADATFRLPRAALPLLATADGPDQAQADQAQADQALADAGVTIEGDPKVLARLTAVLEAPDPNFAIVTP
jgi:alkyl sulfatase BDS1-like metallo-beta-lactamase superfamily hydrolase